MFPIHVASDDSLRELGCEFLDVFAITEDATTLSRDDCCALGKWIYGEGQRLASRPSFSELIERHKRFHQVAGQVGELVNRRAYREATDALAPGTPFSNATTDVVMVLSSAKRLGF